MILSVNVFIIFTSQTLIVFYFIFKTLYQQYFTVQNMSVDFFGYIRDSNQIRPVVMEVQRYAAGTNIFNMEVQFDDTIITDMYNIDTMNTLGPFDPSARHVSIRPTKTKTKTKTIVL